MAGFGDAAGADEVLEALGQRWGKSMALEPCRFSRTTHRQKAAALQRELREGMRCFGGGDRRKEKGALWDGRTDQIQDKDAISGERR